MSEVQKSPRERSRDNQVRKDQAIEVAQIVAAKVAETASHRKRKRKPPVQRILPNTIQDGLGTETP